MMETGDDGLGNDLTEPFGRSANRCVFPEGQVRPGLIVVAGVRGHDPVKMCLTKHDHMVDDSRRIEPINRSAYAFCQGERGAMGRSRMPRPRRRRITISP
jgi:hypothetical protein